MIVLYIIYIIIIIGDPSRQSPSNLYVDLVVYEVKHQTERLMKFMVVKNLDAHQMVIYIYIYTK